MAQRSGCMSAFRSGSFEGERSSTPADDLSRNSKWKLTPPGRAGLFYFACEMAGVEPAFSKINGQDQKA